MDGRGLFWWADDPIPKGQFAPNSCVAGLLKIENDGSTSLELDGFLPSKHGPMAAMAQEEVSKDKRIRGLLKGSGQHMLLGGLVRNGGQMRSNGISYERYMASACLVSEFGPALSKMSFRKLVIPLSGYEEWLRLKALEVGRTRRTVSVKYKRPKNSKYDLADGSLTIEFDIDGQSTGGMFGKSVSLKETAAAVFRLKKPIDLDAVQMIYQLFEDFLVLLTSKEYGLDWPSVASNSKSQYRVYYRRLGADRSSRTPPQSIDCIVNFDQLRDSLGTVWETWRSKREQLGPGLYLYLGTRRGLQMYVEHRFVNLVWGLEALHRKKHTTNQSTPLKKKIERILEQVEKSKDRDWLCKKLENAHEPSLGERISEVIGSLQLGLDSTRVCKFSDRCAKLRNDISHFGGQRQEGSSYKEFLAELLDNAEALANLYQMLLLREVGIGQPVLKWWVFEGFRSYPIKVSLVRAGLLDESEVKPKAS